MWLSAYLLELALDPALSVVMSAVCDQLRAQVADSPRGRVDVRARMHAVRRGRLRRSENQQVRHVTCLYTELVVLIYITTAISILSAQ
jgi:hypothetical protein